MYISIYGYDPLYETQDKDFLNPNCYPTIVDPLPGRRHASVIRFLSELFGVIYLFVVLLLLQIGRRDSVADYAVDEAEDPEGLVNEDMPPSLDHVDPTN